ncbi:heterokaryon incompatibility protein-domain-containing protein, partial [Cercophora newfieldiana]
MWLIDTATLQLKFFPNAEGLKYAILSHTWGPEEISFQEMATRETITTSGKLGWSKIGLTCKLALETYGLKYAWIDTCCIDKTSSADLSEAINSMFAWYQSATVCLAYLEDFTLTSRGSWDNAVLQEGLKSCKWFTRGWTLQELIAPSDVSFYDGNWTRIGTKKALTGMLSAITHIDENVLHDVGFLPLVHVGKKMSWAASRKTTRIEDMAYCLLGIFDIQMPLLYGEGKKAFLRLQEQIARSVNDLTLFAWEQDASLKNGADRRGLFALTPCEFKNCNRLQVLEHPLEQEIEFTFTNRGLRI